MKRFSAFLSALFAGLVLIPSALADIPYPEENIAHRLNRGFPVLPVALLILAVLAVTALLVRHFTRTKK